MFSTLRVQQREDISPESEYAHISELNYTCREKYYHNTPLRLHSYRVWWKVAHMLLMEVQNCVFGFLFALQLWSFDWVQKNDITSVIADNCTEQRSGVRKDHEWALNVSLVGPSM